MHPWCSISVQLSFLVRRPILATARSLCSARPSTDLQSGLVFSIDSHLRFGSLVVVSSGSSVNIPVECRKMQTILLQLAALVMPMRRMIRRTSRRSACCRRKTAEAIIGADFRSGSTIAGAGIGQSHCFCRGAAKAVSATAGLRRRQRDTDRHAHEAQLGPHMPARHMPACHVTQCAHCCPRAASCRCCRDCSETCSCLCLRTRVVNLAVVCSTTVLHAQHGGAATPSPGPDCD